MVQSYSPGGTNVPSHEGTLAQPGEYDWVHNPKGKSIGSPISHSSQHSVVGHIGATRRIRLNLCIPWAQPSPQPKLQIDRFSHFCTANGRKSHTLPLLMGDLDPHLIYNSLGQSKPTTQTASPSVQPFLHRWLQHPYILQWAASSPSKLPHPMGDLDPHLIHGSLGPPESST